MNHPGPVPPVTGLVERVKLNKNRIVYLLLIVALAVLAGGCSSLPGAASSTATPVPLVAEAPGTVGEGRLVPNQYVTLSFNTGGTVGEVLVAEGELVDSGQVIARLDQRDMYASSVAGAELELVNATRALNDLEENAAVITAAAEKELADAREALRQAERSLENLISGSRATDIDSAAANVVLLKDELDRAREDFAPYENKPEDNLTRATLLSKLAEAQQRYDDAVRLLNNLEGSAGEIDVAVAEGSLSLAQAQLALAEEEYEKVKDGPNPDDLATAQARLHAAETALAAAQAAFDDTELKAPFSGLVAQLNLKAGEQVAPGQPAAVLADFSEWIVETQDLTEIEVPRVSVGSEVRLTFDALPGLELVGVVESIGDLYVEKFGDVTYTAKIRLKESDPRLRWGMTAIAHFEDFDRP
jgi:multidrug resistance efflux pump